jgi:hypothetical protein
VNGIFTYPDGEGEYWERPASLVAPAIAPLPGLDELVGIEVTGGASRYRPKKSLGIKWRTRYGADHLAAPLFAQRPTASPFADLILRSGGTDGSVSTWSMIRDPLLHQLFAELGGAFSACEFVQLYLNDQFWGVYTLRERINEDYIRRNFGVVQADVIKLEDEAPKPIAGALAGWQALNLFFQTNNFSTPLGLQAAAQHLDLDRFTDYQILLIYAGNVDWPHNNLFAWRPRNPDGPWQPILWDGDLSFGMPWWEGTNGMPLNHAEHDTLAWATRDRPRLDLAPPWLADPAGREAHGDLLWSTLHLRRLLENAQYRSNFVARFEALLDSTLSPDHILPLVDEYQTRLAPGMDLDAQRWTKDAAYPGQWTNNLEHIRHFIRERPGRIRAALASHLGQISPPLGAPEDSR